MGQNSKIEWTDHTVNLWWGCTSVHSGCDNCYAEAWSKRFDGGNSLWGNDKPRRRIDSVWNDLKRYQKIAAKLGAIHRVFVGSMMDIFERPMRVIDSKGYTLLTDTGQIRTTLFDFIEAGTYPNLLFLFLTKRPSNINKYIPESWQKDQPWNVIYGTSIVDQKTADTLIPQLLQVNGKRFLSVEPQLDELSLAEYLWQLENYCEECGTGGKHLKKPCDNKCNFKPIHWVIQGGESGPNKRPFKTEWAWKLKEECELTRTPYFFKQIDKVREIPDGLHIREFPIIETKPVENTPVN